MMFIEARDVVAASGGADLQGGAVHLPPTQPQQADASAGEGRAKPGARKKR